MRPIEELMAYYTFIQLNGRRKRRPKLSEEAKAIALSFEKIMRKPDYFQILAERFENDFSLDELKALIEVYQQSVVEQSVLLENKLMVPVDMDLAFEKHVASFTLMQEREQMRKRFRELEPQEEELMVSMDEGFNKQTDLLISENLHRENKSQPSIFGRIILAIISLALISMLIRILKWLLF